VTFHSYASNLVSEDTNGFGDIFVHYLQTGQTICISKAPDGTQGNEWSSNPSISADGSIIGFHSHADNLVSDDTNGFRDAFIYDMGIIITPTLETNYSDGTPGSYFNVTGIDYPSSQSASVTINGSSLGNITTSTTGSFTFTLSTDNADDGIYYLTVSVNPSATTKLILNSSDPIRQKDGSYDMLDVPSGIALFEVFLPLVIK
jgi:hypothetical protein